MLRLWDVSSGREVRSFTYPGITSAALPLEVSMQISLFANAPKEIKGQSLELTESYTLSTGENRIEVSTLNTGGQESLRALALLDGPAFAAAGSRGLSARAISISKVPESKVKKKSKRAAPAIRPWLLERDRYIYQDLSRRTGAWVFSSSRGGEYSYESKKLENGLFTEALLKALSEKEADANKDGSLTLSELRQYVSKEVMLLSNDMQHPTVDRDNLYLALAFLF